MAEQDTDNLDSQRKLEETATVAIEAIEARRIAEEKVEADFLKEAKSMAKRYRKGSRETRDGRTHPLLSARGSSTASVASAPSWAATSTGRRTSACSSATPRKTPPKRWEHAQELKREQQKRRQKARVETFSAN